MPTFEVWSRDEGEGCDPDKFECDRAITAAESWAEQNDEDFDGGEELDVVVRSASGEIWVFTVERRVEYELFHDKAASEEVKEELAAETDPRAEVP